MEILKFNDFSAGWVPSDDPIKGRKNGLLKMNAVELDSNGALTLTNGCKNWRATNYPSDAHTLYSKFISGVRKQYVAMEDGSVYRDATSIITGGSITRTAFCAAYDYVFIFSGDERYRDDGTTLTPIGIPAPLAPAAVNVPLGPLTGTYEYAQMNVYNSGSAYKAQSVLSAPSTATQVTNGSFSVTAATPSAPGNEVWIFRRGGNLDAWYRVKVLTSAFTTPFLDATSDADVLQQGIMANVELFQTAISGIADPILEAIPSVNGRMLLFTHKSIFFTESNSPDNYNPRYTIDLTSSNQVVGTEIFLWARKVGENIILVGTTCDIYILSGTYKVLPDGYLDIYFRGLGVDFPPIGIDCAVYNRAVVYMAKEGWRMAGSDGSSFSLVAPNTDKLYRGHSVTFHPLQGSYYNYDYGAVPTYIHPTLRYNCAITKDKLWVIVPIINENLNDGNFSYRMEVYDFIRKYWRPMPFNWDLNATYDEGEIIGSPATRQLFPPTLLYTEDDGALLGFFNEYGTRNLREVDHPPYATDGKQNGARQQIVDILTLFNHNGSADNFKTPENLRLNIYTGGSEVIVTIFGTESKFQTPLAPGVVASIVSSVTTNKFEEVVIDISSLGDVNGFALQITGAVADFLLTEASIDYEAHPIRTKYIKLVSQYYGPNKKRPRVWPLLINTFGNDVTFTPIVDGVAGAPSTINASSRLTKYHHFITDVFGVDYSATLIGANYFELWDIAQPEFVQTLPLPKRFDQIGPEELFRYSKIKAFEVRLLPVDGLVMPFTMYFNDDIDYQSSFNITPGKEATYFIQCPKTTAGEIIRLELGPTEFDFHRFYVRIQRTYGGRDSELEWTLLGADNV